MLYFIMLHKINRVNIIKIFIILSHPYFLFPQFIRQKYSQQYFKQLPMKSTLSSKKNLDVPKVQDVKFIEKPNGVIKGYAVNTFHGMVKNYNEDRVSIIMNITKPNFKGKWPKCSYFGIFDGHGGHICSDFLKDNMHKFITQNSFFPHQPIQALKTGFKKAQTQFVKYAQSQNPIQRSGSCAIVLLIIDNTCYVANVGDSRAILSANYGRSVYALSRDHKPDSQTEKQRIYNGGGKIYQSSIVAKNGNTIYGPFRIQPGKLSVSRSFGDIEAKIPHLKGNPKVLIAKPQITYFTIDPKEHDFIMMGSDGIFDKLQNQQITRQFWQLYERQINEVNSQPLNFIGKCASRIISKSMEHNSMDNLTSLLIIFQTNNEKFLPKKLKQKQTGKQKRVNFANNQQIKQFKIKRQISTVRFSQNNQNQDYVNRKESSSLQSNNLPTKKSQALIRYPEQSKNLQNSNQSNIQYKMKQDGQRKISNSTYGQMSKQLKDIMEMQKKKSQSNLKKQKKQSIWNSIKQLKQQNPIKINKIRY